MESFDSKTRDLVDYNINSKNKSGTKDQPIILDKKNIEKYNLVI